MAVSQGRRQIFLVLARSIRDRRSGRKIFGMSWRRCRNTQSGSDNTISRCGAVPLCVGFTRAYCTKYRQHSVICSHGPDSGPYVRQAGAGPVRASGLTASFELASASFSSASFSVAGDCHRDFRVTDSDPGHSGSRLAGRRQALGPSLSHGT
jgi:hypothetical protein